MQIHRYWTGDASKPDMSAFARGLASQFGTVTDWTDDILPSDVASAVDKRMDYVPDTGLYRARHRSNLVRLRLLHQFGGLWLDHDVLLLDLPKPDGPWIAMSNRMTCSAAMRFEAGDDRLEKAWDKMTPGNSPRTSSGEWFLHHVWGDEVKRIELPFDVWGVRQPYADQWAIHFWYSGRPEDAK